MKSLIVVVAAPALLAVSPGAASAQFDVSPSKEMKELVAKLEGFLPRIEKSVDTLSKSADTLSQSLVKASENVAAASKEFDPLGVKLAITTLAEQNKQLARVVEQQQRTTSALRDQLAAAGKTVGQPGRVACYTSGDGKPGVFIKAVDKWYDFGTDGSVAEFEDVTGSGDKGFYHLKHAGGGYVRLYKSGEAFGSESETEKGKALYKLDWRK